MNFTASVELCNKVWDYFWLAHSHYIIDLSMIGTIWQATQVFSDIILVEIYTSDE